MPIFTLEKKKAVTINLFESTRGKAIAQAKKEKIHTAKLLGNILEQYFNKKGIKNDNDTRTKS